MKDTQVDNQSNQEVEVRSEEVQVEKRQEDSIIECMVGDVDHTNVVTEKETEQGAEVKETERNEMEQNVENNGEQENDSKKEEAQQEAGWSSPAKACRSPNSSKVESEVSILSNSRFSILSLEEEGEIIEESAECEESTRSEMVGTDEEEDSLKESVQFQSENISTVKHQRGKEVVIPRQSLPRESKDKHKFLSDSTAQKAKEGSSLPLNKKNSRNNH